MIAEIIPEFNWTVSVDTLLTIATIIVGVTLYISNQRATAAIFDVRLQQIDASMEDFRQEIKKLGDIVVTQALQTERLNHMEERGVATGKRLDELTRRFDLFLDAKRVI